MNEPDVTDSAFMGPWLADTIRQCDGLVDALSYWTFSDVFEEQGVVKNPFYGGFGLLAEGSVPKPVLNAFALLHLLGDRRLPLASDTALATRRTDGSLAIAVWNLFLPEEAGREKQVTLEFTGLKGRPRVLVHQLDSNHGSPLPTYRAMGEPATPTREQFQALRKAAELPPPREEVLANGSIRLTLPPQSLFLIEIR
jgi:xylan 1,4-beta-xylosidase